MGEAGFDSPAKLAGRPRMRVPPLPGGIFILVFLPVFRVNGHCTASILPPKI